MPVYPIVINSKKSIITEVKPIANTEVVKAAKKISTVVDTKDISASEVVQGIRMVKLRDACNYWHMRTLARNGGDFSEITQDIAGYVVATISTPNGSYSACSSSLGRALASASKQLQSAVMDSLDLDSLI